RLLIDEIVVNVQGQSEQVQVAINWAGGFVGEHTLLRPVRSYAQLSDYPQLCARIAELRAAGQSLREVADQLNAAGFRPPKRLARLRRHQQSRPNQAIPVELTTPAPPTTK